MKDDANQLDGTNDSIMDELKPTCRVLAEVNRRKLQYFGRVVRDDRKQTLRKSTETMDR